MYELGLLSVVLVSFGTLIIATSAAEWVRQMHYSMYMMSNEIQELKERVRELEGKEYSFTDED